MIKVGDMVKLTNIRTETCEPIMIVLFEYIDKIGTVIECRDDIYAVKFEDGTEWYLDISETEKGHLEWVKDED